jgi:hypothetical protein
LGSSTVPSFSLSSNPSAVTMITGLQGTSTITLNPLNGFSGTVTYNVVTSPSTLSCSFTSPALSCMSTGPGSFLATVIGTSGTLSSFSNVVFTVTPAPPAPSFTLVASPSPVSVPTSTSGTSTITVVPANGFTGTVAFTVATNSTNLVCTMTGSTLSCSSSITGHYLATVTGTSGTLTSSVPVIYVIGTQVNQPPTLNVPGPQTVKAGTTITFTITASDTDGDTITLTTSTLPTGATFNSSTGVFTWTPTAAQAGGSFTIAFTATDSGSPAISVTQTVTINITP